MKCCTSLAVAIILSCNMFGLGRAEIKKELKRVADWQILHFDEAKKKTFQWGVLKHAYDNDQWTNGALYVGMVEWAKLSKDDRYWKFLKDIGAELAWKPKASGFMADDICVSRMYLELYDKYKEPEMLAPTLKRLDYIIQNQPMIPLQVNIKGGSLNRWSWCDALFMAPPVFYKLSKLTNDAKYHDFAKRELKVTYDTLYVKSDSLFLRDTDYKGRKEKNGMPVYWARGNGWVVGGLANMILNLQNNDPLKKEYIQLFKEMTTKIASLQKADGFWSASLLDVTHYPSPETSSTGFMTYSIAWGINQGYLDKKKYRPIAIKGWNALVNVIEADGKLGYAQAIGASPDATKKENSEVYGVGSFLLAGSEVYKLVK